MQHELLICCLLHFTWVPTVIELGLVQQTPPASVDPDLAISRN